MHHYLTTLINGGGPLCAIQRLKPVCNTLLSSVAFNFNLRRYTMEALLADAAIKSAMGRGLHSSTSPLNLSRF
jgi:hypothetical protein